MKEFEDTKMKKCFFLNMGHPRTLFVYFVFSNKHQYNFDSKYVWKMSIKYTGIRTHNL